MGRTCKLHTEGTQAQTRIQNLLAESATYWTTVLSFRRSKREIRGCFLQPTKVHKNTTNAAYSEAVELELG